MLLILLEILFAGASQARGIQAPPAYMKVPDSYPAFFYPQAKLEEASKQLLSYCNCKAMSENGKQKCDVFVNCEKNAHCGASYDASWVIRSSYYVKAWKELSQRDGGDGALMRANLAAAKASLQRDWERFQEGLEKRLKANEEVRGLIQKDTEKPANELKKEAACFSQLDGGIEQFRQGVKNICGVCGE